jgi:hypothetical protein
MLQANPALTPNQIKAILQYTSQVYSSYDPLTQGAGFVNARGAVRLAQYFVGSPNASYPSSAAWSQRVIWGNRLMKGGRLAATANAWPSDVTWGIATTPTGQQVNLGLASSRNVVWGSTCGGGDCEGTWTVEGASHDDSVVWGTENADSVVWGTSNDDSVVWGTSGDSVVWGTSCTDPACEPVMWSEP